MERSMNEKEIIRHIQNEEEKLPYDLQIHSTEEFGGEAYYVIPEKEKYECLKKCWPFIGCPKPSTKVLDIHSGETFPFKDAFIIRWENRNVVVCPDYFQTGGMCVDIVEPSENLSIVRRKIRKNMVTGK